MSGQTIAARVARRALEPGDIVVLDLVAASGGELPGFEAGAHIDLHLRNGLVRQYSLCGDPAERTRYRLGILRDPASRGGSVSVHEDLQEGSAVAISAPRNLFPLAAGARQSVLIGGGIGVTPMIAMAHALARAGSDFSLHYSARSRSSAAFLTELATTGFADRIHLHFDDEAASQHFLPSRDLPAAGPDVHLYVCGPKGFMDWVIAQATNAGHAPANVHLEYFQAETDNTGGGFEVVLKRSGKTVIVHEGESIVSALDGIGVKVQVSCEQGICGTCLCDVLEGEPDHRDSYLTDDEKAAGDQIILCCSRAKSPQLVLDL